MEKKLILALIIVFAVFGLVLRNFPFSQGNLEENKLPIITSFDLFAGTSYAKHIYDSGDAVHDPPYRVMGVNSITVQPIFYFFHIAAFTKLTTLPIYQTTVLITQLSMILIILSVFVILKKVFNEEIAFITAALAFFPEYYWFFQSYIGFQYDIYSYMFIPIIIYFIIHLIKYETSTKELILIFIILSFAIVSQWLSHFVELIVFSPFIIVASFYLYKKKHFKKELSTKTIIMAAIIFLIIFLPYFLYSYPIFKEGHLSKGLSSNVQSHFKFGTPREYPVYWPKPRFNTLLNVLSIIGIIGIILRFKKLDLSKKILIAFIIYTMLVGFSNYVGLDPNRFSRQLFTSLPFLTLIPAYGIYLITNSIFKGKLENYKFPTIIIIALTIPFLQFNDTFNTLKQIDGGSFINEEKWNALMWIKENTTKESKVFYLNGFVHEFEMFAERTFKEGTSLPNPEYTKQNFENLCNRIYPEKFGGAWGNGQFASDDKMGRKRYLLKRKGLLNWDYVYPLSSEEDKKYIIFNRSQTFTPIKIFDYVVAQHKNAKIPISNRMMDDCAGFFIKESEKRGHKIVYENNEITILKINKSLEGDN